MRTMKVTESYPRDDALGLPDAPHLRGVQNEGGLALDLLAEAVRVQHLVGGWVQDEKMEGGGDEGEEKHVRILNVLRSSRCSR